MLTVEQVSELADAMVANDLASLEVKGSGYTVRMTRAHGSSKVDAPGLKPPPLKSLSPATGLFRPRGGDDGLPELKSGAQVLGKEPLGYIEIGPFRVLCVSPTPGRITGQLPKSGTTVTMGDPLFTVEPRR